MVTDVSDNFLFICSLQNHKYASLNAVLTRVPGDIKSNRVRSDVTLLQLGPE